MPEAVVNRMYVSLADIDLRSFDDEEQSFTAFASKPVIDRHGTVLLTEAWDLANFRKNPVICWSHNYDIPPVGSAMWIRKTKEGLKMKPSFATTDFGREVYQLYKEKVLRAFSVGFYPHDWKYPDEEEEKKAREYLEGKGSLPELIHQLAVHMKDIRRKKEEPWLVYTDVELLEVSCVPVPSCPDALVEAYKAGRIKTRELRDAIALQIDGTVEETLALEDIYELRPFPNEHSCRLEDPGQYNKFRRDKCKVKHDGKCIDFLYGIKEGKAELQSMRYKKDTWTEASARAHCKDHDGSFEGATEDSAGGIVKVSFPSVDLEHIDTDAVERLFKARFVPALESLAGKEIIEGVTDSDEIEIDEKELDEVLSRASGRVKEILGQAAQAITNKEAITDEEIRPSKDVKDRLARGEIL